MDLRAYKVGKYSAEQVPADLIDPRGLLWVWEEPERRYEYVVAVDPTMGIPGWTRQLRTKDDHYKDNAAIEVFRKPGVQVAEFAAPIDPYELAGVCNYIGKMFAGSNEEGQALLGIEVQPGPGWQVQQDLIQKYGYTHLPPWLKYGKGLLQAWDGSYGWYSTRSTRLDLWTRGTALLQRRQVILRSPWLIDEMVDCTPDSFTSVTGRASRGLHDDRVQATLMDLWWLNEWSMDIDPTERTEREEATPKNYQAMAIDEDGYPMTVDRATSDWNDMADRLLDD